MPSRLRQSLRSDNAPGVLLALIAFAVYLTTVAPSVGFIDAGELAAAAATLGIAHPTGYPLFTLLAGAFVHLPLGGTVIGKLNLFAALCTAASVFFFFRFFLALLRRDADASGEDGARRAAAAIGALTLAFSRTVWEQATGVEVYSLHLLLISLLLWLCVDALPARIPGADSAEAPAGTTRRIGPAGFPGRWLLPAYVLGLSFANHMTTVLLLPGIAWLFLAFHGFNRAALGAAARALPAFLAGLSLYLYLPVRVASQPALNWGNPLTWEAFWRHVSGAQYRVWMFSSSEVAWRQLGAFLREFPVVFGWAALAPMLLGAVLLFRRSPRLGVFVALLFLACVAYAVNYDIDDISNYFLLAHVAAAFWTARGAWFLLELRAARRRLPPAAAVLAALCAGPPLLLHHGAVNERGNFAVEDYARNLFASLDSGAVLLTYQWDHFVSAALYFQQVEGRRPDVTVLDRELLRRSWYVEQLEARHPALSAAAREEIRGFLRAVRPFERGEPYDGDAIQAAFVRMVNALLLAADSRGPVYCTAEVEPEYLAGFRGVPRGLAFRLHREGEPAPPPDLPRFAIRPFPKENPRVDAVRRAYAAAYVHAALHHGAAGDDALARRLVDRALAVRPGYPQAVELRRRMEAWLSPGPPPDR